MRVMYIDCIEVVEADMDGRTETTIALVSNKALADELISESPGWRHWNQYKKRFIVYDTMHEFRDSAKKHIRAGALAKLTEQEKEVLGL